MSDARRLLQESPLFQRLDEAALDALLQATSEVSYPPDAIIVREGEAGDALYLILAGAVQIYKQLKDGSEIVIARSGRGESFGEQALMPGHVRLRNASVRACEPVRLCRVEKSAFQAVLAADDPLKEQLLKVGDEQLIRNLALESSLFRALQAAPLEAEPERAVARGQVIFAEGDPSDALYLVLDGAIEIYRDGDGRDTTLATLGPGRSFGELGILESATRSASARAAADSRLMVVPASRFHRWQAQAPELAQLFRALRRVYKLPNRGRLMQNTGTFLGREAVTNVYELDDGRTVVVSLVVGDDLYNGDQVFAAGREPAIKTLTFADPARQIRRQLRLSDDHRIVGLTAHGLWPTLAELQRRLLDNLPLEPGLLARFEADGTIAFDPDGGAADALLCSCVRVERRAVTAAIAAGCGHLAELQSRLGCGTVCGACIPTLRHLLGNELWSAVQIAEVRHPVRDVLQLRLRPLDRPVAPALPGQHVVVSGFVAGEWVQRAYTLSSACNEPNHYEITVKREPRGQFSNWLFDQAGDDTMLRVSPPRGDYFWRPTGRPVVFVVAGIGVTPALAVLRSMLREGWREPLHVDCSVRQPEDLVGLAELTAAAAAHPHISHHCRATSRTGRIAQADVDSLPIRFPNAEYFLCGPAAFMESVGGMLRRAGVRSLDINVENFTPAAGPTVAAPPAAAPPAAAPPAATPPAAAPPPPPAAPSAPLPDARPTPVRRFLAALFRRK